MRKLVRGVAIAAAILVIEVGLGGLGIHPLILIASGFAALSFVYRRELSAWRQLWRANRRKRPPPKLPAMTLLESVEAFLPARDLGHNALSAINDAMRKWQKRTTEIKTQFGGGQSNAAKYWHLQAQAMNAYADDFESAIVKLAKANDTLAKIVEARIYWHDRRGVAVDLLTAESLAVFGTMRHVSRENQAKLRDNQRKLDESVMGWDPRMDSAASRWRKSVDGLIDQLAALETVSVAVLLFRRKRIGWLGWVRTLLGAKLRRLR